MNGAPKAVASVMITSESPSFTDEGTEAQWVGDLTQIPTSNMGNLGLNLV